MAGASRSWTWTASGSTRCSPPPSKAIRRPQLDEVDAGIGMRDAAVGKMLRAQAQVAALLRPEQHAGRQVVAVLEMGGEIRVGVDAQVRQQVKADRRLEVRHQRRARGALEAEHRGDPE